MTTPRRYEKGVTNVAKGTTMGMFLDMDPSRVYGDFDDFFKYEADTDWVLSEAGTGTQSISATHAGGALVSVTEGAAGDHAFYQRSADSDAGTLVSETHYFQSGKQLWFKARFKVYDAAHLAEIGLSVEDLIIFAGLYTTNTDPVNAAPGDGVYFHSPSGSSDLYLRVRKGSEQLTTTKVATMGNLTWITVGYHWDGSSSLHYYIGDNYVDTLTPSTYLPDDEELAISHGFESVNASIDGMYIDYIGAWCER